MPDWWHRSAVGAGRLIAALRRVLRHHWNMRPNRCYAQEGEDIILDRMMGGQKTGFYVDIGAHHPARFSNTYLFYRRGWTGINVDAEPGAMRLFDRIRPRDINIEAGVGAHAGTLQYYRFNEPALNTFSPQEAALKNKEPYRIVEVVDISVRRLDELLDAYLPKGQEIDFLSVDVEGLELDVLRSNDWIRFRPRFVLVEALRTDILRIAESPSIQLLGTVGYVPVAKSYNTVFLQRSPD